jgi:hypothetical protein
MIVICVFSTGLLTTVPFTSAAKGLGDDPGKDPVGSDYMTSAEFFGSRSPEADRDSSSNDKDNTEALHLVASFDQMLPGGVVSRYTWREVFH